MIVVLDLNYAFGFLHQFVDRISHNSVFISMSRTFELSNGRLIVGVFGWFVDTHSDGGTSVQNDRFATLDDLGKLAHDLADR